MSNFTEEEIKSAKEIKDLEEFFANQRDSNFSDETEVDVD